MDASRGWGDKMDGLLMKERMGNDLKPRCRLMSGFGAKRDSLLHHTLFGFDR